MRVQWWVSVVAFLLGCSGTDDADTADGSDQARPPDATDNAAAEMPGEGGEEPGVDADVPEDVPELDAPPVDGGADGADADDGSAVEVGVGPRIAEFTPSGPVVLVSGMTVSGLHITNPDGPCIHGDHVTDVHIADNRIGPCGPSAEGVGVNLYVAHRVRIDHNAFDDVASALYVNGEGAGDEIVFDHNLATRIRGPMPRGQLVQFDKVHGSGNRVLCNVSDQTTPGYLAGPEDHVNIFSSSGTAASPIEIAYNKVRGGGPSDSGGGLLAGDNDSAYVFIHDNILISPGQYGLAIAGGHHFRYLDNRIYSPDAFAWSNVGCYVWNQTDSAPCYGHEVRGNRVFYVNREGTENHAWNAGNCGEVAGWDTDNVWGDPTLSAAMWDETFAACE